MDIEIAIDVLEMAKKLDHVVLFSGDGDFRRLVEAVQRKGIRFTVVSTQQSAPPMVADELRRQADIFLDLQDMAPLIVRAQNAAAAAKIEIGAKDVHPDSAIDARQPVSADPENVT
jgi:uncharacterized LabA/DUF88 family protein